MHIQARLDLNDINARAAKEMGVKMCINSDAHEPEQLKVMKYGVNVARRAWLEKKDLLNTLQLARALEGAEELKKKQKERRVDHVIMIERLINLRL